MAVDIISKAYEKRTEDKVFSMWLALYPNMDKESFVTFDDFKDQVMTNPQLEQKTDEEILKEVAEIRKALEEGGESGGNF